MTRQQWIRWYTARNIIRAELSLTMPQATGYMVKPKDPRWWKYGLPQFYKLTAREEIISDIFEEDYYNYKETKSERN